MAYFKGYTSSSGEELLAILDDKDHHPEQGTSLIVHTPLIGRLAAFWPKLTVPFHMDEWSQPISLSKSLKGWTLRSSHHRPCTEAVLLPSLGRRIIDNEAKWGSQLNLSGEFQYIPGYWEWTEDVLSRCKPKLDAARISDAVHASLFTYDRNVDIMKAFYEAWCPSTNTLLTSLGEMSISLYDMRVIAGLPVRGKFYDEVVPSARELTGTDKTGAKFVPRSCKHLFCAFRKLHNGASPDQSRGVPIAQWVKFWCKKATKYHAPPARREKRVTRPKSTANPSGDIEPHEPWSASEEALFASLNISGGVREEAYLAAFLSCWICTFVLPIDNIGFIRPSVFKMASIMASGQPVSLAIPVLASIYQGLNRVVNSCRPSQEPAAFAIHYVYGWISHYFRTYFQVFRGIPNPKMVVYSGEGCAKYYDPKEARKRIHKGEQACWTCNVVTRGNDILYVDNDDPGDLERDHFTAIRSSYLTLRRGDYFDIEPYSPHRFSRQFGFCQEVPGSIDHDVRRCSLGDGLRYWRLCLLSRSMAKVRFPHNATFARRFFSSAYKKWWALTHGGFLEENIARLLDSLHDKAFVEEVGPSTDSSPLPLPTPATVAAPPGTSKRKNDIDILEDSGSSTADRHWKRTKRDSGSSHAKDGDPSHGPSTEEYAKEVHYWFDPPIPFFF